MASRSFQGSKFHKYPRNTDITYIDLFPGFLNKKNTFDISSCQCLHIFVGYCMVWSPFTQRVSHHAWKPRGVVDPFRPPRGWKKNEESNSPLTPVSRSFARSHAGVCLHEANRGAESHQPDVRRINAIIARSASRFIDRWLHHFAAFNRPFDCFSVSLLIPAFWFFVFILRILPFFLFVVVLPFLLVILYLCIIS